MTCSISPTPYRGPLLNPCADPTFKILFTSETEESRKALTSFLSAVIGKNVTDVSLQPNELSGDSCSDKQSEFDINCKVDGEYANIEVQGRNIDSSYGLRAEYHAAHLMNHYTPKGMDWVDLPKVYQISVLNFIFDKEEKDCVNLYQMQNSHFRKVGDRINIIFIELPKIKKLPDDISKLTKTEMWGKFFLYANMNEKQEFMENLCKKEEGIKKAMDTLTYLSQEEINWSRETYYWLKVSDEVTRKNAEKRALKKAVEDGLKQGIEQGIEQGIVQGIQQGLQQGVRQNQIQTVKNCISMGISVEQISKITGLSPEDVEELRQER